MGGAFCTTDNVVLDFNGINNFINNSVPINGGAIFTKHNISLRFTGTSMFSSNSARQGGAIAAGPNITLTFDLLPLLAMEMLQKIAVVVQYICLLVQVSPLCLTQLCAGLTIMQI